MKFSLKSKHKVEFKMNKQLTTRETEPRNPGEAAIYFKAANSAQNSQLGCSKKKKQTIPKKLKLIYAFFITMTPQLLGQNVLHD